MNKLKGFTLIELLIIISILGIISTLILINTDENVDKSKDFANKQDLEQISYKIDSGKAIGLTDRELKNVAKEVLTDLELYDGVNLIENLCGSNDINVVLNFLVSRDENKGVGNCLKEGIRLND